MYIYIYIIDTVSYFTDVCKHEHTHVCAYTDTHTQMSTHAAYSPQAGVGITSQYIHVCISVCMYRNICSYLP
jgi:hypothetical protein